MIKKVAIAILMLIILAGAGWAVVKYFCEDDWCGKVVKEAEAEKIVKSLF